MLDTLSMLAVSVLASNISQPLLVEQSEVGVLDGASLETRYPANGSAEPIGNYGKAGPCVLRVSRNWSADGTLMG